MNLAYSNWDTAHLQHQVRAGNPERFCAGEMVRLRRFFYTAVLCLNTRVIQKLFFQFLAGKQPVFFQRVQSGQQFPPLRQQFAEFIFPGLFIK